MLIQLNLCANPRLLLFGEYVANRELCFLFLTYNAIASMCMAEDSVCKCMQAVLFVHVSNRELHVQIHSDGFLFYIL